MNNETSTVVSIFKNAKFMPGSSRKNLIDDGDLIDVTAVAREVGFLFPVAVTKSVWNESIKWDESDNKRQCFQSQSERLWDVLYMGLEAGRMRPSETEFRYEFHRIPRGGHVTEGALKQLKLRLGPGDKGEPVITIMQVNED